MISMVLDDDAGIQEWQLGLEGKKQSFAWDSPFNLILDQVHDWLRNSNDIGMAKINSQLRLDHIGHSFTSCQRPLSVLNAALHRSSC